MQSYQLRLGRVAYGKPFYQCVYVLCETSAPVMEAAAKAKAHFGLPASEYMPHLSLLYSNISPDARCAFPE